MRGIIDCTKKVPWVNDYFPGEPPYLLPIANKPYLEYLVDYCVLQKIKVIYLLCSEYQRRVYLNVLGNGERWSIRLCYVVENEHKTDYLSCFLERRTRYLKSHALLVLSGYFWLKYDQHALAPLVMNGDTFCKQTEHFYLLGEKRDSHFNVEALEENKRPLVVIEPFNSIQDFYAKVMLLVAGDATHYQMPNYGNMKNINIGQNVSWDTNVEIQEPVHFGNMIQIESDCVIGPSAVIGSHVFIDHGTSVSNSIIMPNTYVGAYLEIDQKILFRNMIIDPLSGCKFTLRDDLICDALERKHPMMQGFFHRLGAFILLCLLTCPYVLIRPLIKLPYSTDCYAFLRGKKRQYSVKLFKLVPHSFFERLFLRLNLDRYHLLFYVLCGRLRLIGNLWVANEDEHRDYFDRFPDYAIGLFSYSEMLGFEDNINEAATAELYYMYHASFYLNVKIFFFIILQRLLKVYS